MISVSKTFYFDFFLTFKSQFNTKMVLDKSLAQNLFSAICRDMRKNISFLVKFSQPAITCSKLTIETLEQGVKCVQN